MVASKQRKQGTKKPKGREQSNTREQKILLFFIIEICKSRK